MLSRRTSDGTIDARAGQWLKRARLQAGQNPEHLAARVGVHFNTINNYEAGRPMSLAVFARLCWALDARPADVLMEIVGGKG